MRNLRRFYKKAFGRVTITLILIILQALWFALILSRMLDNVFVTSSLAVIKIAVAVYVASRSDNSAYRIGFILLILIVPILGIILYALYGHGAVNKRARKQFEGFESGYLSEIKDDDAIIDEVRNIDKQVGNICRHISKVSGYPIYHNEMASYQKLGDDAFVLLKEELNKAREFIFMEYFIIEADGQMFGEILSILEKKVSEGVEVKILYDDIGSIAYFGPGDLNKVRKKGIDIRCFNKIRPVKIAFMNNRDHRKITVIDGRAAFTGGYNIADEYINKNQLFGHWKDAGLLVKGKCVDSFTAMFLSLWKHTGGECDNSSKYFERCMESNVQDGFIQPFSDMPLDHEKVGEDVYLNIIKTACDYVYIFTPYLIIDNEMMSSLCLASKSGIDVRIVTPGIPDKRFVYELTQSYYKDLLESGVKIYHYKPGFVHSKVILSDDDIAMVGTINLDYRSFYLQFECGAFLYKADCIKDIKDDFIQTFAISEAVDLERIKRKNIFVKALHIVLRLFAPLM